MSRLPCPCGTGTPLFLWRKRSSSHLYVMRCPTCGRQSAVATSDFEKLDEKWNETVRATKVRREGAR